MVRAGQQNVCQLVTYGEAKERMRAYLGSEASQTKINIYSSMMASVVVAVGVLPVDNIKTKLLN